LPRDGGWTRAAFENWAGFEGKTYVDVPYPRSEWCTLPPFEVRVGPSEPSPANGVVHVTFDRTGSQDTFEVSVLPASWRQVQSTHRFPTSPCGVASGVFDRVQGSWKARLSGASKAAGSSGVTLASRCSGVGARRRR
jgi:hypothetical protein